jgi:hypothetical protein
MTMAPDEARSGHVKTTAVRGRALALALAFGRTGLLFACLAIAACSGFGQKKPEPPPPEPNAFPSNYRSQIVGLLATSLTDRADFRGALIAPPVLKPVGENQHYVVCIQLNGHNQHKEKIVVFLGGVPNIFVDAKPDQCTGAAYEPFRELEAALPAKS